MQLQKNYKKKKIFVFFSFGISLKTWHKQKILEREVSYYKKFQKEKYNLTFVTYGNKNDLKFKNYTKDIEIIPLYKNLKKNYLTKYLIFLIAPLILSKTLDKCEIIKTHQVTGGLLALICAIFKKKKLIIRAGWEPTKSYKNWNISFFKYLLLTINSMICYKFSNKIIATTREIKNFISKKYFIDQKKINIIPNVVNVDKFRKKTNIKKIPNRVINISRLESQKNLFELIDICKLSEIDLDIIGSGIQLNQLKNYSKKIGVKVNFLGQIENNKIPNLLSKYIFYITSSKIEGSPKTILEAMSSELPIIGLKAEGVNSLIKNGKTGYLFSDKKKLTKYILNIKENKIYLKKMGIKARKYIIKNFCAKRNIIAEKKIFEELTNEKRN